MEIQHFQGHFNLIVGIIIIFIVNGSCFNACAISTEVIRDAPNSDSHRYITSSYFMKHNNLLDSDFQDYITNDLTFHSCEVLQAEAYYVPRLSVLHRHLKGEGSHRQLSSSIRLKMQPHSKFDLPSHSCEAIIVERLPSGVFADPFELQHLVQRGVFADAAVFGDTNLELPSFHSNRSVVELHVNVGSNLLSDIKEELGINIDVPIHARYAPLEERGFSKVEFGRPDLFMRCTIEGKSYNQSCLFVLADNSTEPEVAAVWEVPCGIKDHAVVVSVVTFTSAVFSALLIVLTSIYYSESRLANHLKPS